MNDIGLIAGSSDISNKVVGSQDIAQKVTRLHRLMNNPDLDVLSRVAVARQLSREIGVYRELSIGCGYLLLSVDRCEKDLNVFYASAPKAVVEKFDAVYDMCSEVEEVQFLNI